MAVEAEIERISKEKVKASLGAPNVTVIDVRAAHAWNASNEKVFGAVHEDPGNVDSWKYNYRKDGTIFLY